MRTAEGEGIDVQQRAAFGSARVTGYFVLQPAVSATASEPAGCAPLYLSALPSPLVATGFAVRSPAEAAVIDPGAGRRPPWPAEPFRSSGLDPAAAPLLGRGPEVEALGGVLDRVAAGQKALVLIEGEAGIGKTRLLDGALEDARARGMQVTRGRAGELEQTRPFGLAAAAFGCTRSSADPRRASDHQRPRK